jgi:DNA-binding transcriptional regulator PaaX
MGRLAVTSKDILLTLLGADGTITVPERPLNMAVLFAPLLKSRHTKPQLTRAVYRLRKLKFITVKRAKDQTLITLSPTGKKLALRYALDDIEIEKPARWDERWQVVMFDIPNRFRSARNALRGRLNRLGLFPLQESVWISPYPCPEEVKFIAQMYGLEPYIKTMTISSLDEKDAAKLKKIFDLR